MTQPEDLAAALERSEARFRNIIQKVVDGIVIVDVNGNICFANPAAEMIFSRDASELVGSQFGFPVVAGETTEIDILYRGEKTNIVEMRVTETEWEARKAFLATLRDVTERIRAKQEIENLNNRLAARAAEVESVNRELEAFSYSVSHDLRTPLNIISLSCQLLQDVYGEKLDDEIAKIVGTIFETTSKMGRLIDALLNFSRLAHAEPRQEIVDLSELARKVAADLKFAQPERQATFLIQDGIVASGDASLLKVVMDNLLGNAWKYTGRKVCGMIEFGLAGDDGERTYYVRDNGAGFDMADAERLFIPFNRLSAFSEVKGFGIGLATVDRIIRRHGGRIWAEGTPDKGATFYFTLKSGDGPV